MKRIIIFASGSGSNAENIVHYFRENGGAEVVQILSNNPQAKILERCKRLKISAFTFNRVAFNDTDHVLNHTLQLEPDLIVLAGFLWKVPENFVAAFSDRIVNIHPALLPKYGGKGMYGHHVYEAVVANKETESGITIHYVNENYDEGNSIFQAKCKIDSLDSAEDVAAKIHQLEMEHFPKVIASILVSNG